jgi:O-glycosyl hydrolase
MNTRKIFGCGIAVMLTLAFIGCENLAEPSGIPITIAAITITGPVKGVVPLTTAAAGGIGYTCGAVLWSPDDNPFKGGTVYTAVVTLTADADYTFTGLDTATVNAQTAVIVNNTGKTITLMLTFAPTNTDDPDHTHDWGEWIVTTAPTATKNGVQTRTCKLDATHTEEQTIPATGIKTDPMVTWPQGLTAMYGQTLFDIVLDSYTNSGGTPGAFSWPSPSDSVGGFGTKSHNMTFTPDDTEDYNTLTQSVVITITKINITAVNLTITGPVKGSTPVTTATTTGTDYTCGTVSWNPDNNPFLGGTVYTAAVTLTAYSNYTFTMLSSATINGQNAAWSNNTGAAVTLSYTFPETDTGNYLDETLEPNATVTLNSTRYQYVRGFGGMDITWDNFFEISMDEYDTMYNPDKLGFNIMRIMINPIKGRGPNVTPDGPTAEDKKFVHTTDPLEFLEFITSAEGGRPNYYNGVKKVNSYGGYVLASPWSPPAEWKTTKSISGGIKVSSNPNVYTRSSLETAHYQDYANYLRTFAQKMSQEGAPIYAISIQNEPNYDTSKEDYEGCGWTDNVMRDFFLQVRNFTAAGTNSDNTVTYTAIPGYGGGKATERVLIMNGESANTPAIHTVAMQDPISSGIIDLLARHNYGENTAQPYNPGVDYGKEMWMTEWNKNSGSASSYPNDSTWNYVWLFLNDVDMTIRQRSDNAYIWWALKRFYSMIGDGQYGTTEGDILPRGYALSHYAKFAKEKWRIGVDVEGELGDGSTINFNSSASNTNVNYTTPSQTHLCARVTAFMSDDGKEVSVIMYTPTNANAAGTGGYDLGKVRINLPPGFIAKSATGMRSNAEAMGQTEEVKLDRNGSYTIVDLPGSNILSIKFRQ